MKTFQDLRTGHYATENPLGNMDDKDIKSVYFAGAGGIGMSALERYFLSRGLAVGGYDRVE